MISRTAVSGSSLRDCTSSSKRRSASSSATARSRCAFARADEEIWQEIESDSLIRSYWRRPGDYDIAVERGHVTLTGKVN